MQELEPSEMTGKSLFFFFVLFHPYVSLEISFFCINVLK